MGRVNDILNLGTSHGVLCVDVESSGYSPGHQHGYLRTVQFGVPNYSLLLDVTVSQDRRDIAQILENSPHLTAHHAHTDNTWLAWEGFADLESLWAKTTDTLLLHQILHPTAKDNGLKPLGLSYADGHSFAAEIELKRVFTANGWLKNTTDSTPIERSGWAQIPIDNEVFVRYANADVLDGSALCTIFLSLLHDQRDVVDSEHRIAMLMSLASYKGTKVSPEVIEELEDALEPRVEKALSELHELGVENPNSNPQIAAAFQARDIFLPSYDKNHLANLTDDLASTLLEYRDAHKALNTTVRGIKNFSQGTGRVHSTIKTLGARTGRMSSSEPNLQNVPPDLRCALEADNGTVFVSVDFSSVEPRVIAGMSEDEALLELYSSGGDPYWNLARYVYGEDADKGNRQAVKSMFLGRAYMGGARGISEQNGLPLDENERGLESVDALYPRVREFSLRVANEINVGKGYLTMPSGRRVFIPADKAYKSGNGVVQGYARDLLVLSIFKLHDEGYFDWVRFPVHDEIIACVPEDDVDKSVEILLDCMSHTFRGVPIIGEATVLGKHWRKG